MDNTAKKEVLVSVDPGLEKLIPKFITAQKAQFELIKVAFKNLDYDDLIRLGHQMKGSCGGYGFFILGDLGSEIEKHAKAKDPNLLKEDVNKLETCLANLKIEYRKA